MGQKAWPAWWLSQWLVSRGEAGGQSSATRDSTWIGAERRKTPNVNLWLTRGGGGGPQQADNADYQRVVTGK